MIFNLFKPLLPPKAAAEPEVLPPELPPAAPEPEKPIYTQSQLNAAVNAAVSKVERSAGRSIMMTLNGMSDMARKGKPPTEGSVMDQMERSLQSVQERCYRAEADRDAARLELANTQAKFQELASRVAAMEQAIMAETTEVRQ